MDTFLDRVLSLFGRPVPVDFGRLDRDDKLAYWRVDAELDRAERAGGLAQRAAVYAKHGLKDEEHWERVKSDYVKRFGDDPEFQQGAARVHMALQSADLSASTGVDHAAAEAPVLGVSLEAYVRVEQRVREGERLESVLAAMQLHAGDYATAAASWRDRLDVGKNPMTAGLLQGKYQLLVYQLRGTTDADRLYRVDANGATFQPR